MVEGGRARRRMALILHSGDFERLHNALSIAMAAAANGMDCYIFAGYGALAALTKGRADRVPPDTSFRRPLSGLLRGLREAGALHLHACGASVSLMGVDRAELVEEFEKVSGLSSFLQEAEGAEFTLFV